VKLSRVALGLVWAQYGIQEPLLDSAPAAAPRPLSVMPVSSRVRAPNSEPFRHSHQFRQRPSSHLLHHPPPMDLDGDLARAELGSDLLVEKPGDHALHHLSLARRQRFKTALQFSDLGSRTARSSVAFDRLLAPRPRGPGR